MTLTQIKGNTWAFEDWEYIPLYKLDDRRCVLLDTGMWDQQEALTAALDEAGLTVVGVLCSHAHIDHMGNNAYFQRQGAQLAMSLGEAGQIFSAAGLHLQYYNYDLNSFPESPELGTAPCLPDRIILPHEDRIEFCGAVFDILHTPGHTVDHLCVRTPDGVLYLADAVMTGRTLHHSKFPYAFNMMLYLDSLARLRTAQAEVYLVAHKGIYHDILPFIDLELSFLLRRMLEFLDLVGDYTTPKKLTAAICQKYRVHAKGIRSMAYFEQAGQTYIHYLTAIGHLEAYLEEDEIRYRRTEQSLLLELKRRTLDLPRTGGFRAL